MHDSETHDIEQPPPLVAEPGLRERKRSETRLALESAALDLALEVGLDSLTVEQIAERANVSRRTFFNYFAAKEDALVGDTWESSGAPGPVEESLEADLSVFETLRTTFVEFARTRFEADELLVKRMRVFAAYPQLAMGRVARAAATLDAYTDALSNLLARRQGVEPSRRTASEARMLLHLCAAVLHHATDEYLSDPEQGAFTDALEHSFDLLMHVKESYL